jgi:hypothetical protein
VIGERETGKDARGLVGGGPNFGEEKGAIRELD